MTNVESIRQPTREQKRHITEMLTACYDTKAGRYTGTETDKTIAEAIGGGCMFGWVAAIREDMFGLDGGNEGHAEIATALLELSAKADTLEIVVQAVMDDLKAVRTEVKAMQDKLTSVVKAVGPKAVRA
jgi:outer membrane murein-binding lipoprotein Lpp